MHYQTLEINSLKDFEALQDEWNRLLSLSDQNTPFLRHEWLTTWWKNFGEGNTLAVILVKKDGRTVFALPLMEVKTSWLGISFITLKSLTNYHSYRYNFIVEKGQESSIDNFWEYIKNRPRKWDLLQVEEIPSHTNNYKTLLNSAKKDGYKGEIWRRGNSAYISIKGDWDNYWNTLKPKFRSNLRNRTKRINKIGSVAFETVKDKEHVLPAVTCGFEIEKKSWKGVTKSAIACNPKLLKFYTEIAELAAEGNWLQLTFLKVGETYAAFDYSLVYNNSIYCMKIGYDPEFRPYSVGQLLCKEILKDTFACKMNEYDFLGEMTTQKRDWTPHSHKIIWLFLYNRSLMGKIHHLYKFIIKNKLKRVERR